MDFVADQRAQGLVDHLVTLELLHALEFLGDDQRSEMRVVVAFDAHAGLFKARFDQARDFAWIHCVVPEVLKGAQCTRKSGASQWPPLFVYDSRPIAGRAGKRSFRTTC